MLITEEDIREFHRLLSRWVASNKNNLVFLSTKKFTCILKRFRTQVPS